MTNVIGQTIGRKEIDEWRKRVGEQEADRIVREAGEWGESVHKLLELNDKGRGRKALKMIDDNPSLLPPYLAWREWVTVTIKKWVAIEEVVWSPKLRIAGRIDRVGYIEGDDQPSIIDIKTGELWESVGIQVWGAYRELWECTKKGTLIKGLAVQLPRREPGVLKVKNLTQDKYIRMWQDAKRDFFNARGEICGKDY